MLIKISVCTPSIRPALMEITQKSLSLQTFKEYEWLTEIGIPSNGHDLNRAYNRMLRRAKGELFISLQDAIYVRPDYLQRAWEAYQANPDTFLTFPVGKVDNLNYLPPAKWDWRAHQNTPGMTSDCWEIDSAAAPLSALKEIGGFDEALDGTWSSDNVNVGCRAELAGYKFKNIWDNPAIAYNHDLFIKHPFRETFSGSLNIKRMAMFRGGMKLPPMI